MQLSKKELRAIKKNCRQRAHKLMLLQYERYDAIWWNRIRITPSLYGDHGRETVRDINMLMPNLLTHNPCCSAVDDVSEEFGFDTTSDLVEYLLAYKPRGPVEKMFYENLLADTLDRLADAEEQSRMVDEVPF